MIRCVCQLLYFHLNDLVSYIICLECIICKNSVRASLTLVYRRGVVTTPLRIIFRPAKTLNVTIKWVQLIVGSTFPVILAQKIYYPTLG